MRKIDSRNKLFTAGFLILFLTIGVFTFGQTPGTFNYQAVLRDGDGNIRQNSNVDIEFVIHQGTSTGSSVYDETHTTSTNTFGLVNLEVGSVDPTAFALIDWSNGPYFIEVVVNDTSMGSSQLLSVPYALHAASVDAMSIEDADADPTNEIQSLHLSGTVLSLSLGGGTVTLPSTGGGGDNWGTQVVESNGTLTGEGTTASPLGVQHTQLLPDWDNIQDIPSGFDDGIDDVDDADHDPSNELQSLSIDTDQLTLSDGGGTVTLPSGSGGDNWGTQVVESNGTLTGEGTTASPLGVQHTQLLPDWDNIQDIPSGFDDGIDDVDDADHDPSNELQSLSIDTDQLTLSDGGGTVTLPSGSGGGVQELNDLDDAKSIGYSVFVGQDAGMNDNSADNYSTGIGYEVLYHNTGMYNTATGYRALYSNTEGIRNTASGYRALSNNTTGTENTANGFMALLNNEGHSNTAIGYEALILNTTGRDNTAIGAYSLRDNTIGIRNTAIGFSALWNNLGNYNTATGYEALHFIETGLYNTAAGYRALFDLREGQNNIGIGAFAQVPNSTGSNQVRIGNTSITYAGIEVDWSITSDMRWKEDIRSLPYGLDMLMKLKPVDYVRKNNEKRTREMGIVAQDLEEVLDEIGYEDQGFLIKDDNGHMHLRYNDFTALLIKSIQDQQGIIKDLEDIIGDLDARIAALERE